MMFPNILPTLKRKNILFILIALTSSFILIEGIVRHETNNSAKQLLTAQSLLPQDPNKAEKIIANINSRSLNKEQRNLYDIIIAQENLFKNGRLQLSENDKNFIEIQLTDNKHHELRIPLAYLKSLRLLTTGKSKDALVILLEIERELTQNGDKVECQRWGGFIHSSLADCYAQTSDTDYEIYHRIKAEESFSCNSNFIFRFANALTLSDLLNNSGRSRRAIRLIEDIRKEFGPHDSIANALALSSLLSSYYNIGCFRHASMLYPSIRKHLKEIRPNHLLYDALKNLSDMGFLKDDSIKYYSEDYCFPGIIQNNESVLSRDYSQILNNPNTPIISHKYVEYEPLSQYENDFYSNNLIISDTKNKYILIGFSMITILLISFVVILITANLRANKLRKYNENRSSLTDLQQAYSKLLEQFHSQESEDKQTLNNEETLKLVKTRMALIDKLCSNYSNLTDNKVQHKITFDSVSEIITDLKKEEELNMLRHCVEILHPGLPDIFEKEISGLKNGNISLFYMKCLGLSAKSISTLLGINLNYYYLKKKRLFEKIKKDSPTHANLLLSIIE